MMLDTYHPKIGLPSLLTQHNDKGTRYGCRFTEIALIVCMADTPRALVATYLNLWLISQGKILLLEEKERGLCTEGLHRIIPVVDDRKLGAR